MKNEKWPGQFQGLPEPGSDEWKEYHKKNWELNQPISELGPGKSDPTPVDDLIVPEKS